MRIELQFGKVKGIYVDSMGCHLMINYIYLYGKVRTQSPIINININTSCYDMHKSLSLRENIYYVVICDKLSNRKVSSIILKLRILLLNFQAYLIVDIFYNIHNSILLFFEFLIIVFWLLPDTKPRHGD